MAREEEEMREVGVALAAPSRRLRRGAARGSGVGRGGGGGAGVAVW